MVPTLTAMRHILVAAMTVVTPCGGNTYRQRGGANLRPVCRRAGEAPTFTDSAGIFEGRSPGSVRRESHGGAARPINDQFCPNSPVTRGQMAAFPHRALG